MGRILFLAWMLFAITKLSDMAMRKIFFLAIMCFLLPRAANAATYDLAQAVAQAVKANPGIEAIQKQLETAKMNIGVAQSNFWPRAAVSLNTNRLQNVKNAQTYNSDNLSSYNWAKGLRVSWNLFSGLVHLTSLQQSVIRKDIAAERLRAARLELEANVQLQFLALLRSREDLKSAKESIARLEEQLKSAEAFVREGMAPYLNVLQNQTELASAQQRLIRVENDIRNAEVQLNRYLGLAPNEKVNYRGNLRDYAHGVKFSEEEAIKAAERGRPDLVIAKKSIEVAWKDMQIAMGQFLPRIDANYDNMGQSKDYDNAQYEDYTRTYWSAGLSFSWEFFSGGNTIFQTLSERKKAQGLRKEYEDAMANARSEVIRSLLDIQAAKDLIAASIKGVDAARESYAMADKRYATNTGTITELLDAQTRLTEAENAHSEALAQYQTSRARFFYSIDQDNPGLK